MPLLSTFSAASVRGFTAPGASAAATVAYTDKAATNVAGNATFNSFGIGTAAANRYVVIAVTSYVSTPSAVTVGGISATLVKQQINSDMTAQMWIAAVPTGTTATVIVTKSGGAYINIIGWALTNLTNSGAASSTAGATASGSAMTLATVPAGSVVIAAAATQQASQTVSWTNINKDADNNPALTLGGASIAKVGAADGLQVTGTMSGTPLNPCAVSAAFR
jgi:hypothetical protein